VIVDFVREHAIHREAGGLRWGVEPTCAVLSEHGVPIAPSTYYEWTDKLPTQPGAPRRGTAGRDPTRLHCEPSRVWAAEGVAAAEPGRVPVAPCTVERLMRIDGLAGVRRGTRKPTTIPDPAAALPADLVCRDFEPLAPNRL
jgi:putative transposase